MALRSAVSVRWGEEKAVLSHFRFIEIQGNVLRRETSGE